MRYEGPDTEVIAESSPEPYARASAPPLHPRVLERFEVGRCLGTGTFGVVYEARERAGGTKVALKKLSLADAGAVYAFKQEFRALADVVHENLVRLDELFSIDDGLYLAMELVDGVSFFDYVRPNLLGPPPATPLAALPTAAFQSAVSSDASSAERPGPTSGARLRSGVTDRRRPGPGPVGAVDEARLRAALRQLALGVLAVHRANKLHRDLKPSNVLTTPTGRVVILDFGLVAPPGPRRERRVVGTPAYMSPEQARGLSLEPASDWYSVGVMLYEALTGELPVDGDARAVMDAKQGLEAPDPRVRAPGVSDDLAELCRALLDPDSQTRATGAAVLRVLGGEGSAGGPPELEVAPLTGREHHLVALEEAFAAARETGAVTLLVHGSSGMGKSALCRRFLDAILETRGALVLEGRCYERELTPFKALDPIVDALASYVGALPRDAADALLPPDVEALSRLFPVLHRVPAVHERAAAAKGGDAFDPAESRRRAGIALRRLLERIAEEAPLVIAIDDLQWGDADRASLLLDLLAPPDPPRLLLLAGYRSEDAAGVHLAAALHRRMARGEPVGDVRELRVGPLGPRAARSLARALLAPPASLSGSVDDPAVHERAAAIAHESGGSPFFVYELARHARAASGRDDGAITLDDLLRLRVEALAEPPQRLLEVIAVAGRPIGVAAAERAAGVGAAGALSVLRAASLVKIHGGAVTGARTVEPFHDRIRVAALARLEPEHVAQHALALALALEAGGTADPESLLVYFDAGGDAARARVHAEAAAAHAAEALAFDRAAALYRRALDGASEPRPLRVRLARALADAGRGAEAGSAYLEAAAGAPPGEALDLRRCAAEQLLRAGHVDDGLVAVRDVLDAVDLSFPPTPARAFASLLYRRARLSLRGLDFAERESGHSPEELTRIDVCWSVGNGLNGVDIVRGADFQARHLLYALEAGEPYRIARALASEALFASMEGARAGRERSVRLIERSTEIAERIAHPRAVAWAAGARAGAAFYEQRFRDAAALSDRAVALFREARGDTVWELGSIVGWFLLPSLWFLGRLDEIARRLPAHLKEAEDLGALYNLTSLRTLMVPRLLLAHDRPIEARRESQAALARWSNRHGWHAQHCCDMYARAHAALYMGDGHGAHVELEASARDLDRSYLLRLQAVRVDAVYLRGSAAVAAAPPGPEGASLLKAAERDARALGREEGPYARAFSRALAAAVALERGRLDPAAALYAEAAHGFEALEMGLHAAAMRWRRGEVVLGDEGRALIAAADAWMREQGVVRPDRIVAMLAPVRE